MLQHYGNMKPHGNMLPRGTLYCSLIPLWRATGEALVTLYMNRIRKFVCLFVCLFVCPFQNSSWGKRAIYMRFSLNVQKFTRECIVLRNKCSGPLSGRYCPETGHWQKKPGQNGLFLEVFGTFDPLPDTVFNPNFKRSYKAMQYTFMGSFRKFGVI